MRILIAPDSFKGSLSSIEAAKYIEIGIRKVMPEAETIKVPMADGGEGTLESLVKATDGEIKHVEVIGPLGNKIKSYYGLLGDNKTAVVEMALASGLNLIPQNHRDPMITTTYGTGELIKCALREDIKKLIIGIGGSSTNDAGVGMAQALGASFLDKDGNEIGYGGGLLDKIINIDLSGLTTDIYDIEVEVACDVNNPLYGYSGAAHVYARQKGADDAKIKKLDYNLKYFSELLIEQLNINISNVPGAGAAGGLGGGLLAFLKGKLRPGIEIVLDANNIDEKIKNVDLVITGEGRLDNQTTFGKTPVGVAKIASKNNVPVIAIAGTLGEGFTEVLDHNINCIFSIVNDITNIETAMKSASSSLIMTTEQIMRVIKLTKEILQ